MEEDRCIQIRELVQTLGEKGLRRYRKQQAEEKVIRIPGQRGHLPEKEDQIQCEGQDWDSQGRAGGLRQTEILVVLNKTPPLRRCVTLGWLLHFSISQCPVCLK